MKQVIAFSGLLFCCALFFCTGCVMRNTLYVTNASPYPIEMTTDTSFSPSTKYLLPLESVEYVVINRHYPAMRIYIPETGETYKYQLGGNHYDRMAIYENGVMGFSLLSNDKTDFVLITPNEEGWVVLGNRIEEKDWRPRMFTIDEWNCRKQISEGQVKFFGNAEKEIKSSLCP